MGLIEKNIPGTPLKVFLREGTSDSDLFHVLIEEDEYGYIEFLRPPNVIVDVGANIGLSSLYFAAKYPDAKIYAIEPEKGNYEMLKRNAEQAKNIIPVFAALMAEDGYGKIFDPGLGDLAYQIEAVEKTDDGQVVCKTVQSFCDEFNLSHIDLLKIDAEGTEKEIFEKPGPWISQVSVLIIELHERIKEKCNLTVFEAIKNEFQLEWIGGENFYFSKDHIALPKIPTIFKGEKPAQLPIEHVWELQAQLDEYINLIQKSLLPIYERIDLLTGLYPRVDAVEGLYPRVDAVEGLYPRVDAVEGLYPRVDALEGLYPRMGAVEGLYPRVDALEGLHPRMGAVEGLYPRVDALESLYSRMDIAEGLYPRVDALDALCPTIQERQNMLQKAIEELQEEVTKLRRTPWHRLYHKLRRKRKEESDK